MNNWGRGVANCFRSLHTSVMSQFHCRDVTGRMSIVVCVLLGSSCVAPQGESFVGVVAFKKAGKKYKNKRRQSKAKVHVHT